MALYKEDIIDIDLETGMVSRDFIGKTVGEGDAKGNRFGVRVLRNGQEVNLTGITVIGYFIRANGTTVVINGSRSGSTCWVELPQSCYAVEGVFTLSIKITYGGTVTTARIIDGSVVNTVLGEIIDPGNVVPELSDFASLVARAEAAAGKIESIIITATQITGTRYKIAVTKT